MPSSPRGIRDKFREEAVKEIARNLREWGVVTTSNKSHREFAKQAVRVVEGCHEIVSSPRTSQPKMLPKDIHLAVEAVFREDLETMQESRCRYTVDRFTGNPSPPYYVKPDKL